jgi:arylsulfatase
MTRFASAPLNPLSLEIIAMKLFPLLTLTALALTPLTVLHAADAPAKRPNILIIVADDMGFSDAGCYGGEIQTPNLDGLAAGGLRFTQFYSTARCWPSRAAILTGYYPQAVRRDNLTGDFGDGEKGGIGRDRPSWAQLLPEYLKPLGYHSYHSGKWHVDGKPLDNGFEHPYQSANNQGFFSSAGHSEDNVKLPEAKVNGSYYSTIAIADHAIKYLKDHAAKATW